jgi:hypothetical protein
MLGITFYQNIGSQILDYQQYTKQLTQRTALLKSTESEHVKGLLNLKDALETPASFHTLWNMAEPDASAFLLALID